MRHLLTLFLTLFLLTGAVQGQVQFFDPQNLSNEYGPSDEHDIAAQGGNYYLVWNQWGDIMYRKSENHGQNWGEKLTLYSGFDYGANYPVIAASGDHVYVVYYRNTSGDSQIFMVKSDDGGITFGNEIQIGTAINQAQVPQIEAQGDTVLIAYEDRDENWDYQIYLTMSLDAGETWSAPVNLSNTTENARWCNVAMDGSSLVVVWNQQTGASYDNLDLFVTTTTDFGQTWSSPANITNNGAYNARLNTSLLDESIYIVVSAKVDGLQSDIMLYRSNDFGDTWQSPVNLSDNSGASSRPDIWVTPNYDGNHRIYTVWSDETYNANERAYLKYSIDNGYTWSELLEFSQETEDAAWVQVVGDATGPVDELYMAWYRPDDGTFNYEVWGLRAQSQVSSDVTLSGTITDTGSNPVENATVALSGYITFSQPDGSYSLEVPAGTYDFSVAKAGYQTHQQPGLELQESTVIDVTLQALIPGNYPPHNLHVEQQGVNDLFVTFEEPIGFNSMELAYDDGEANGLFWVGEATGNEFMAVAFEHDDACYLRQLKLFTGPGTTGEEMMVYVMQDNNGSPDPENLFGGPYLVSVQSGWTNISVDIPVPAGVRFYIASVWNEGNLYKIGGDLNEPDGFSYSTADGGETWYIHDEMDFMIRAGIAFDEKGAANFINPSPQAKDLLGYNLYLDGTLIETQIQNNYANIDDVMPGETHTVGVSALYDSGESPMATAQIFIPEPLLFPPVNLTGSVESWVVTLNWEPPASEGTWLQWDDGVNSDAVGGENIEIFDAAIRFTTDDLQAWDGHYLTKISAFITDANCQVYLRVWQGGNQYYAGDLIREQHVAYPIANEWNTYDLETPVLIDASQELWFGYRIINPNGVYPAGTDNGPAVPTKGDMLLYGSEWISMSSYFGWDINWNIHGFVVDPQGRETVSLNSPALPDAIPASTGVPQKIAMDKPSDPFRWEYSHFNIYRNDELLATVPAETFTFTDEEIELENTYVVTTAWDEFESAPSNEVFISIVGTDEMATGESSLSIRPNPLRNNATIGLQLVTGQQVEINLIDQSGKLRHRLFTGKLKAGDHRFEINRQEQNLTSGLYFLQVKTEGEDVVRKLMVVE
ncbi:MAG: exo-alpha-sialidase [Bacteroidales bacterium]